MNTISTMQLNTLDTLFQEKERELKNTIGNLQLNEVKTDAATDVTISRIKRDILLTPVTIGEPKITGNNQITKEVPAHYQNMWGGSQNINVITVSFSFTGSEELFNYRTSGESLSMSSIYLPSYNSIVVEVQLKELSKVEALTMAKSEMRTTFELIKQNNPTVKNWSLKMTDSIEQMVSQKRKELVDFYS
jgi:hypothetical protein